MPPSKHKLTAKEKRRLYWAHPTVLAVFRPEYLLELTDQDKVSPVLTIRLVNHQRVARPNGTYDHTIASVRVEYRDGKDQAILKEVPLKAIRKYEPLPATA